MKILVLNSGSSSLKYQLMEMETEEVLAKGNFERIGQNNSFLTHKVGDNKHKFERPVSNHEKAIKFVLTRLLSDEYGVIKSVDEIDAIGHRVVHGGEKYTDPVVITPEVLEGLKSIIDLAPLHNPAAISGMEACMNVMPGKLNVAVFDTGFHKTIPEESFIYPIPYKYYEKYKIRRYGFHGISHQFVANRVAELVNRPIEDLKIINCHLGQGASICAIKNGKCVDTSMGFTPLGGIPMGTRSGDLDPSVVTYIAKKRNHTPDEMDEILNKKSGTYGISEVSVDFRDIESEAVEGNANAIIAVKNYAYIVAQFIAKYMVSMGGVDIITFTAGIGEKDAKERKKICDNLAFFGVKLNEENNNAFVNCEGKISTEDSSIEVYVVPTNEELLIARDVKAKMQ
ncbi:MAG: acetate kinase [Clostridia bacterium]|nr:acetate kinase [Clostridia bacterium]